MSKEYLEALERLYKCNDDDYTLGYQQHDYKLLQQALQRLEAIDNAKPSEALECLGRITKCIAILDLRENGKDECNYLEEMKKIGSSNDVQIIKQNLIKAQKQDKVLEIIKEKTVNILLLELAENVDEYNERIIPNGKLTEEEFDLLKRYLDNERN